MKVNQFVPHFQFFPGALVGNLNWEVLSPGGALCSLTVRCGGKANDARGAKDGIGTSYAGHAQDGAETGGGGGEGVRCHQESWRWIKV